MAVEVGFTEVTDEFVVRAGHREVFGLHQLVECSVGLIASEWCSVHDGMQHGVVEEGGGEQFGCGGAFGCSVPDVARFDGEGFAASRHAEFLVPGVEGFPVPQFVLECPTDAGAGHVHGFLINGDAAVPGLVAARRRSRR